LYIIEFIKNFLYLVK